MHINNFFIFLGHIIAISFIVVSIFSAYAYFFPLGLALDGLIWYLAKKYEKTKNIEN